MNDAKVGGDLSEYISGNDTPLTGGNYNEVDGLVFAELSYMEFENCDWSEALADGEITVGEFAKTILDNGQYQNEDAEEFLKAIENSDRYSDLEITDMAALNGNTYWQGGSESYQADDGQWAGMTIGMGDGTSVVAFRGTNGTELGWAEDFELAYDSDGTAAQQAARDYLQNTDADKIYMAGHSKGGNDAESAYVMSDPETRAKVARIDNYDGPGNTDEFIEANKEGYADIGDKLHNHFPEDSIIGQLLNDHPGDKDFCPTDRRGHKSEYTYFGEHDPFSWKIDEENGCFVESEQSDFSKALNERLDEIVEQLDEGEREAFIQYLEELGIFYIFFEKDASLWKKILKAIVARMKLSHDASEALIKWLLESFSEKLHEAWKEYKESLIKRHSSLRHSKFFVNPDRLRENHHDLLLAIINLDRQSKELEAVKDVLDGIQYAPIRLSIDVLLLNLRKERSKILNIADALDDIIAEYTNAEEAICSF